MPFLNGGHIWLILALVVVLVIFGPGKLPELGSAVGKTINAFRRSTDELKAEINHKNEPVAPTAPAAPVKSVESLRTEV